MDTEDIEAVTSEVDSAESSTADDEYQGSYGSHYPCRTCSWWCGTDI